MNSTEVWQLTGVPDQLPGNQHPLYLVVPHGGMSTCKEVIKHRDFLFVDTLWRQVLVMSQLTVHTAPRPTNCTTQRNIYHNEPVEESAPSPSPIVRRRFDSGSVQRYPSILSGIRGLMGRQRSESLSCQLVKKTKLKKSARMQILTYPGAAWLLLIGFQDMQVNGCQLTSVYDLREDDEGGSSFYDDEWAFRRPRSNSSDFLILRKTSRPLSVDVVGLVDSHSDPYRQYMRVVDCYELSPPAANIIVLDKSLKVDKAFSALREQNVRAGLIWDASQERICSIVTLTDFLKYIQHDVAKWSSIEIGALISGNPLITVSADTKLFAACEQFCFNSVHRIIVTEPHSGDILYLLTIKRVLQAIHKQNRSLHFAQWLSSSIKDSGVGTWENAIHSVSLDDKLNDVVEKLLSHKLSSLAVVNLNGQATDVITKIDFAMAIMEADDPQRFLRETTVSAVLGHRPPAAFVYPRDPVGKVLDVMLEAQHMRCVFVIDERLKPIACISQCDVISHLIYGDAPFQKPKSPY
ncbi:hypothetical protein KIN20_010123 [Parelaphostrongylus tenuis]|uniref:CBS domain-containing protein n=1 Tax=Parelaphostrongylus tenuis TaxID=148309 RepID=A0AAD5QL69_PARTN|nr:hypothetical protein KIN20_010123 [Parelaphostrongylus tenuis]